MKPSAKKILDEALQLEPTTRAFIVETLLESLDFEDDFSISQEWMEELRSRCDDIDRGRLKLIEGKSALNELRGKYS